MNMPFPRILAKRPRPGRRLAVAVNQVTARLGDGSLALLDQTLVSGGRFFTSVLVGRLCGQEELGKYTLGFTVALTVLCLQDSLVSVPYIVYCRRRDESGRQVLAGSTLVHSLVLSVLAAAVLGIAAVAGWFDWLLPGMTPVIGAVALSIPWLLLREFARRLNFGHLNAGGALRLDFGVTILQLAALGTLAWAGGLSPATAHLALGLGCALVGVAWLARKGPRTFQVRRSHLVEDFRDHWRFGRWLFASQLVFMLQWNAVTWLLAVLAGAGQTGAFAACLTLALLCNPFLLGMSNQIEPRVAEAAAQGGPRRVWRMVLRWTGLMAPVVALFCVLVALLGSRALGWLYGDSFAEYGATLFVMALTVLAGTCGLAADAGLRALERSDMGFRINVASLIAALLLSAALIPLWGTLGAALGMLGGSTLGTTLRLGTLAVLVARRGTPRVESTSPREIV